MAFPSIHIRGPGGGHIRPSPEILAIVEKQKSDGSKLHSKVVEERLTALHGSSDALDPDDENVVHSITTMARFFHSRVNNVDQPLQFHTLQTADRCRLVGFIVRASVRSARIYSWVSSSTSPKYVSVDIEIDEVVTLPY